MRAWALSVWSLALVACSSSAPGTTSDCAQSPDKTSCNACYAKQYPDGVSDYNAVASCIFCDACWASCGSATNASFCTGAPAHTDACDTGDCVTCQQCASKSSGSCLGTVEACAANTECEALLTATCP